MAKPILVKGTDARIYQPTESKPYWRITYLDRATGKLRHASGGKSYEAAEAKARKLSGEFVEGWKTGGQAPTVNEAVELWLVAKQSDWAGRTYQHNRSLARKLTSLYGTRPINRISPTDIAKVEVAGLSRNECERIRTMVRGIFGHSKNWLNVEVEALARAIPLPGTAASKRSPRVERGDIPSSQLVAALIITAHHTLQIGPLDDPETTKLDSLTGKKRRSAGRARMAPGLGIKDASADFYRNGLPPELADANRRVRQLKSMTPEQQRSAETEDLASRYRQTALITALGAGGGLRIGECLALRVRHFLTLEQITFLFSMNWDRTRLNEHWELAYRGYLDLGEQASQSGTGKILVQGTKGKIKQRDVHLPAFLPNWNGFGSGTHRGQVASVIERFEDPALSLWDATEEEEIELWRHGFTPLSLILWRRLKELWDDPAIRRKNLQNRVRDFYDLLLFPTRTKARRGRDGEGSVLTEPGWRRSTRIVEGTGSYQNQSNYQRFSNPLYDYVAEDMHEYPEHRIHAKARKGWTHHGLRHWAVSSRLKAGVPLPLIAKEMGHKDSAFTLERYGHVVDERVGELGFEY